MKKTNISRLLSLIVLSLLVIQCVIITSAMNIPSPTRDFYVNDLASLLDDETEKYIVDVNVNLCKQTGAQVVVVTLPSLGGEDLEEFSTDLFREYGIGDRDKNNGVLMLLALEEREFRIEVGYGVEGCLNDGKTGRIQDEYIIPYLKENNYSEGIINGFNAIISELSNEYQTEIDFNAPTKSVTTSSSDELPEWYEDPNMMSFIGMCASSVFAFITGKLMRKGSYIPNLIFVAVITAIMYNLFGGFYAVLTFIACILFCIVAWAMAADGGGGSSHSSSYHSRPSSRSYSSGSGRSSGGHSGGGGRSGGGGSSRSF